MNSDKMEKLANMAEQSASRIAREAMTFFCQTFSILKDEVINSQPKKVLSQNINEVEGNRFVTLPRDREGNKFVTLPSHNLLTVEQLADFLQVKTKTIYSWAEAGKIPSQKIGSCLRFDRNKILEATQNDAQKFSQKTKPVLKEPKLRMIK